jgi:hypothetical protein
VSLARFQAVPSRWPPRPNPSTAATGALPGTRTWVGYRGWRSSLEGPSEALLAGSCSPSGSCGPQAVLRKVRRMQRATAWLRPSPPLTEMSYEEFERLVEEKGEKGIFEMYAGEIKEYAEWIWREQAGEEYDLDQCIEMAQRELMDGSWGPREEV